MIKRERRRRRIKWNGAYKHKHIKKKKKTHNPHTERDIPKEIATDRKKKYDN